MLTAWRNVLRFLSKFHLFEVPHYVLVLPVVLTNLRKSKDAHHIDITIDETNRLAFTSVGERPGQCTSMVLVERGCLGQLNLKPLTITPETPPRCLQLHVGIVVHINVFQAVDTTKLGSLHQRFDSSSRHTSIESGAWSVSR